MKEIYEANGFFEALAEIIAKKIEQAYQEYIKNNPKATEAEWMNYLLNEWDFKN
jgi:hypothetical protein